MTEKNKVWNRIGIFDNFEDASKRKEEILQQDSSIDCKIRKYGARGNRFQVKTWKPKVKIQEVKS